MIKFTLENNLADQYIVFEGTQQQPAFYPKQESLINEFRDFNYNPADERTFSHDAGDEARAIEDAGGTATMNSKFSATDYIGAVNLDLPHLLSDVFADIKLYNPFENPFAELASQGQIGGSTTDLYTIGDNVQKIVTLANGVQAVRVPADKFNTILTDEQEIIDNNDQARIKNFGKYYIMISPKYIDTPILSIDLGYHYPWTGLDTRLQGLPPGAYNGRRDRYHTEITPFSGSIWNFESGLQQRGRLFGSVVELRNSGLTTIKQRKIITENDLSLDNIGSDAKFGLSPEIRGYDSASNQPIVGDVLRIYPRETYFKPIVVEVDYINKDTKIETLVQFMVNDVARNLVNNRFDIYDDNGITLDPNGGLSGNVEQAYQISKENDFEIRRKIDLDN